MRKKILEGLLVCGSVLTLLAGCGRQEEPQSEDIIESAGEEPQTGAVLQVTADMKSYEEAFSDRDFRQSADLSAAIYVELADNATTAAGRGVTVNGNVITFTEEGVYVLSGSLSNGSLVVAAGKEDKIQLVLEGCDVKSETMAALYVKSADKVFVTTGSGTSNSFCVTGEFVAIDENNIDGAIFAKDDIVLNGEGSLHVNCESDHGIVGKDDVKVTGGELIIDAAGDGIQAKDGVYIGGGTIMVLNSVEGIEGETISIWDGNITIISSDDGMNAALKKDKTQENAGMKNPFDADEECCIAIYGGCLHITADGDGIDSNGALLISGGEIYVDGPTSGGDGAIDYSGEGIITGGTLVAVGAAQMAENMGNASTQCTMLVNFGSRMTEGELTVTDEEGTLLLTYAPARKYNSVVISFPALQVGETYLVTAGDDTAEVTFEEVAYGQGMMDGVMGHKREPDESGWHKEFDRGEPPEGFAGGEPPEGFAGGEPPEGFAGGEPPEGFNGKEPPFQAQE